MMTSKLYSILLLLIFTLTAQAQEYHVETPGTLQEVIGPGAEELTHIRVTGTLNDRDIAFLHYLCWPIAPKPTDMKDESYTGSKILARVGQISVAFPEAI